MWKELIDVDLLCVREMMIYDSLVAFSSEISLHIFHLIVHKKTVKRNVEEEEKVRTEGAW